MVLSCQSSWRSLGYSSGSWPKTCALSFTLLAVKLMKTVGLYRCRVDEDKRGVKDKPDRMEIKLVFLITNQMCRMCLNDE